MPFGALLVVVPLLFVTLTDVRVLNLKAGKLGTPVAGYAIALAISFGLVLMARAVVPHLPRRVQRAVTVLSSVGLMVILTHTISLWLTEGRIGFRPDLLLALLVPWALALLVGRTRLAPMLIGTKAPPVSSANAVTSARA